MDPSQTEKENSISSSYNTYIYISQPNRKVKLSFSLSL